MCSDREAEPIALAFCARGFSAAVLHYPCAPVRFPSQLLAAAEGIVWLRTHAEENHMDPNQIAVAGFSAGGHLAASLGVLWNRGFVAEALGVSAEMLRPDRLILGYPVITCGEFCHEQSLCNLLGQEGWKAPHMRELLSLEKQVRSDTPPTFLWHTSADSVVPVENTVLFAMALCHAGVSVETHIYSAGDHGLALANSVTESPDGKEIQTACAGWIDLAADWLRR